MACASTGICDLTIDRESDPDRGWPAHRDCGVPVARQLRHHPRGLWLLFFTEMWERFSYYGMRSLSIFYLTGHFLFSDRNTDLTAFGSRIDAAQVQAFYNGLPAARVERRAGGDAARDGVDAPPRGAYFAGTG
jgi:hypothetical protein